jgi:CheY-like chemotaxis protein
MEWAARAPGRESVTAASAREAREKIEEQDFDVVVTDLRMETWDAGLDVLKAAKKKDISTQVIVCTAFGAEKVSTQVKAFGAFEYLERLTADVDFLDILKSHITTALECAVRLRRSRQAESLAGSSHGKEVFVSYAWTDQSRAIVDEMEIALKGRGVVLLRDRNEMKYKDGILSFMQRIGRGRCIIVILSKRYLESKSCMFELTEIASRGDIRNRVFPVVLADANIYDAVGRLTYIRYWESKKEELNAAMRNVSAEHLDGVREEIDLFAKIRNTIAGIVNVIGDMNALVPERHQESKFEELFEMLEVRLTAP